MLSIASGRRATIERAKRRRAPGEASEVMAAMARTALVHDRDPVRGPETRPVSRSSCCSRSTATAPRTLGAQIEDQLRQAIREGALRRGAPCRRRATSRASSASRAGSSSTPTRSSPPRASCRCARAPARACRRRAPPRRRDPPRRAGRPRRRATTSGPASPDVSRFPRAAWLRAAARGARDDDRRRPRLRRPARRRRAARRAGGLPRPRARRRRRPRPHRRHLRLHPGARARRAARSPRAARGGSRSRTRATPSERRSRARRPRVGRGRASTTTGSRRRARAQRRRRGAWSRPPTSTRPASCSPRERRTALLAWLRERDAIAIEDDYDAEYRYDRAAVGALQGLEPERVVYAGLGEQDARARRCGSAGSSRRRALARGDRAREGCSPTAARRGSTQLAFAVLLERGELDRHLRRMRLATARGATRSSPRSRGSSPSCDPRGAAAGLHVLVDLPDDVDEDALVRAAQSRGVGLDGLAPHCARPGRPGVILGYGRIAEPAIAGGVRALSRRDRGRDTELTR